MNQIEFMPISSEIGVAKLEFAFIWGLIVKKVDTSIGSYLLSQSTNPETLRKRKYRDRLKKLGSC